MAKITTTHPKVSVSALGILASSSDFSHRVSGMLMVDTSAQRARMPSRALRFATNALAYTVRREFECCCQPHVEETNTMTGSVLTICSSVAQEDGYRQFWEHQDLGPDEASDLITIVYMRIQATHCDERRDGTQTVLVQLSEQIRTCSKADSSTYHVNAPEVIAYETCWTGSGKG